MSPQLVGGRLPYFSSPVSYQRGRGLGGLLRGLFRGIRPLLKKPIVKRGLKTLGKHAAKAVLDAGQQALEGNETAFAPALKRTGKTQLQAIIRDMKPAVSPNKRRRKKVFAPPAIVSVSRKPTLVVRRAPPSRSTSVRRKRRKRDIFS